MIVYHQHKPTLRSIPLMYSLPNDPSGSCRSLSSSSEDEFNGGLSLKLGGKLRAKFDPEITDQWHLPI